MLANIFVAHGPRASLYIKHGILRWHQPRADQAILSMDKLSGVIHEAEQRLAFEVGVKEICAVFVSRSMSSVLTVLRAAQSPGNTTFAPDGTGRIPMMPAPYYDSTPKYAERVTTL